MLVRGACPHACCGVCLLHDHAKCQNTARGAAAHRVRFLVNLFQVRPELGPCELRWLHVLGVCAPPVRPMHVLPAHSKASKLDIWVCELLSGSGLGKRIGCAYPRCWVWLLADEAGALRRRRHEHNCRHECSEIRDRAAQSEPKLEPNVQLGVLPTWCYGAPREHHNIEPGSWRASKRAS